jgi:hypothetical protein
MNSTVADDVAAFLKKNTPNADCDDCIAKALNGKNRRQIQAITASLGAAGFTGTEGPCSDCPKTEKLAVSA